MGGMALVLQVLTNNKFLGYALLIVVMIGQVALGMLDYTQNLYNFGNWPNAPYSDMNGFGHFLTGQWPSRAIGACCWRRCCAWRRRSGCAGSEGLRQRLALAGRRLRGPAGCGQRWRPCWPSSR